MFIDIQKNVLSIIILAILFISLIRHLNWKEYLNKVFLHLILINIACIFLDSMIIITSGQDSLFANITLYISVGLYYTLLPIAALFWLYYVEFTVNPDSKRYIKMSIIPGVLIIFNFILVILSYNNDLIFSINDQNVFARSDFFFITGGLASVILIYSLIHIYLHRKYIRKQEYIPLMLYSVPPLISGIILIAFKDMNFVFNSLIISNLIIYIYIQSKITSTDFLTGLYNRREYEFVIKQLKTNKQKGLELSGMMIDINDFKKINDEFGHKLGDEALITISKIIKASVRKQDGVYRIGGDEFMVVILSEEHDIIDGISERIKEQLDKFNQKKTFPFNLSFSLGKGIYDGENEKDIDKFFEHLDFMMYDQKKLYKEKQN
ncbi:MAG: GGDEF domain-containing protein [Acholeplasmataceae bacterium]|nr:GGDEF domain-containing protein [Acholeplasmataceae bacterium]